MDCFQWERIHEWVILKIDGREFEVFVKKFGSEVYSVQSYLDLGTESPISMTEDEVQAVGVESQTEVERASISHVDRNLNKCNVMDPVTEAILMRDWEYVQPLTHGGGWGAGSLIAGTCEDRRGVYDAEAYLEKENCYNFVGYDPMMLEAQAANNWAMPNKKAIGPNGSLSMYSEAGSTSGHGSWPSSSCPYPPGFGPCTDLIHVHRKDARVPIESVECVKETPIRERVCGFDIEGGSLDQNPLNKGPAKSGEGVCSETGSEDELSDEMRYLINEEARAWARFSDANPVAVNGDFECAVKETAWEKAIASTSGQNDNFPGCSMGHDAARRVDLDPAVVNAERDQNSDDEISDEYIFEEANESRGVWNRGGLFFDSSDDDEVLTRLFNCDLDCDKRATKKIQEAEARKKTSKHSRKVPGNRKINVRSIWNVDNEIAWEYIEADNLYERYFAYGIQNSLLVIILQNRLDGCC
ncbi:hypothetical protein PIB30_021597 [Stylosanthes scabra]|uniref:Uncharacterized protein n=1 Tax=Stylosanthes scabra TaxID=79078 RepID=A0ABU6V8C7_9FABA|nr:hypothetical protein [Stylosanthes scabra]